MSCPAAWGYGGCLGCSGCYGGYSCYGCHGCTCYGQIIVVPADKKASEEGPEPMKKKKKADAMGAKSSMAPTNAMAPANAMTPSNAMGGSTH